jgi:hypothetical protein
LPLNYLMLQNEQYRSDFLELVKVCKARNVAMQTIKSLVHSSWGEHPQDRATWYRPLEEQGDIDQAIHWVLGHAGVFLISAGDVHILPRVLSAAERFKIGPTDEEMQAMVNKLSLQSLFT